MVLIGAAWNSDLDYEFVISSASLAHVFSVGIRVNIDNASGMQDYLPPLFMGGKIG